MRTKYEEIMERIQVTDEMRNRILHNLEKTENTDAVQQKKKQIPFSARRAARKWMAAAACIALLLVGGSVVWHLTPFGKEVVVDQGVNGMEEINTQKELEKKVGFPVEELQNLPFEAESVRYMSYWGEMAEITYIGADQEAVLRKAEGTDDVSGDYTAYAEEISLKLNDCSIRLKGKSGSYTLAVWNDGTYSYSIQLTEGQPQEVWQSMIGSMAVKGE